MGKIIHVHSRACKLFCLTANLIMGLAAIQNNLQAPILSQGK